MSGPCRDCLRRTWLLTELSEHIARARERFGSLDSLLGLDDRELVAALGGWTSTPSRPAAAFAGPA